MVVPEIENGISISSVLDSEIPRRNRDGLGKTLTTRRSRNSNTQYCQNSSPTAKTPQNSNGVLKKHVQISALKREKEIANVF